MFKSVLKLKTKLKLFLQKICKSKKNINNNKTSNDEKLFIYSETISTLDSYEKDISFEKDIFNINRELIMFQQMCSMFGKKYTLTLAAEYLDKLNYDISKNDIANLYSNNKITFITDFRDNKTQEFNTFMKS